MIRKVICLLMAIFWVKIGKALEVDRTLQFSILNFSSSKKTLLLNKGKENGLKKGDQAKFFRNEKNIIARAVLLKASSGRSLWSVFRYRNRNVIKKNLSLNLKITKPIPLTNDVSKRLFKNETFSGKEDRIPTVKKVADFSSRFLTQKPKGDFSSINEMDRPKKKKKVDYSRLNDQSSKSQYKIKANYQYLKENNLESGFGKSKSKQYYLRIQESKIAKKISEKVILDKYRNIEEL
ncbi:hypothetical protein OAK75_03835 [Bacteriovoracales bacterium]|nr:hypothetical protein [Bacteriovoracales bacterium]